MSRGKKPQNRLLSKNRADSLLHDLGLLFDEAVQNEIETSQVKIVAGHPLLVCFLVMVGTGLTRGAQYSSLGFLKSNIGALVITNTILGVP